MNILYVTPYVPSRIRTRPYHLIRSLAADGHQITLLTAAGTLAEEREQAEALRSDGVQVQSFPVPLLRSLANCLRALPTGEPLQAAYAYHPQMERRLSQLLSNGGYDVAHIEHLRAARLVRAVSGVPAVYDSVDCISLLFEQSAQMSSGRRSRLMSQLDLARTRRYEARLLTLYDQVTVTSPRDKEALEGLARSHLPAGARAAPITVITNGVDLVYFRPLEYNSRRDSRTVVFTGKMSYHANVAAALFFAREVLPLVWARDPGVRLEIVGKDPPTSVQELARDERIEVTGYVDDLRPYLAHATLSVCPALYAVGVQNKVLEAMAMATPVVSSPQGCAGIRVESGHDLLVAEGPEAMASAVLQVISDRDLAERLSVQGRRYVEAHHSWKACARQLVGVYERAISETGRTRRDRVGLTEA